MDFVGFEKRQSLIDAMLFVALGFLNVATLDQFYDPARVEIDAEGDASAMLRQVLDSEPETAWAARAQMQPIGSPREKFVGQSIGEGFVIDPEILVRDPGFRNAGGPSGFKREDRLIRVGLRDPAADGTSAQPLVFEEAEFIEIVIGSDVAQWIEVEGLRALDPEGRAGFRAEMPLDNFAGPSVQGVKAR